VLVELKPREVYRQGDVFTFILDEESSSNGMYVEKPTKYSMKLVTQNSIEGEWASEELSASQFYGHHRIEKRGNVEMIRIRK
jgi:hypothetical protein